MSVSTLTFNFVSDLVRRESAIQLAPGKEYLVESRLLPLARAAGLNGDGAVDQYVQRVRSDPAALSGVVEALTTNETSWFRDNSPFTVLRNTLLPQVRSRNTGELRIWSGACSTGQEPYSIAMSLLEERESNFSPAGVGSFAGGAHGGAGCFIQPTRNEPRHAGGDAGALLLAGRSRVAVE